MKTVSPSYHREFIVTGSLADINTWIRDQWIHIPRYKELLIDRIRELKVTISPRNTNECSIEHINTFYYNLTSRPQFTREMYDLLNVMTNTVIFPDYGQNNDSLGSDKVSPWTNMVMLTLMDIEKIHNETYKCFENKLNQILYMFYSQIIDIYLPCENPHALVIDMMGRTTLRDVLTDAKNSEAILGKFRGCQATVHRKNVILLHKIILDIYTNMEASFEFLDRLHKMTMISYYNKDRINEFVEKYKKYFPRTEINPSYFIHSLFSLLSTGWGIVTPINSYELNENIEGFLLEFSQPYSQTLTRPILKVLLDDIHFEIQRHDFYCMKIDKMNYVIKRILDFWGDKKYNVHFDPSIECVLLPTDKPISTLEEITKMIDMTPATEAKKEVSAKMNNAEKKIYKAYRTYKENEEKVDSQITKGLTGIKNVVTGDVREEIIEGKKFSAIGLLKKMLATVALFSYSKIKFVIFVVIRFALKKSTTDAERSKILMEIDTEIAMLEEKINDAKSDNNRDAKYAMMRTKKELENAKVRIQYGMSADKGSLNKTKKTLDESRNARGVQ